MRVSVAVLGVSVTVFRVRGRGGLVTVFTVNGPVTRSVSLEGHSQLPGHYTDWSCYESDVKYTSNISPLNNHLSITT